MVENQGAICHELEHYRVTVGETGYDVTNHKTGVVEATEKMLPQAILHAENSNSFLVNKLWRWVAAQGAVNGEALDKDPSVSTLEIEQSLE